MDGLITFCAKYLVIVPVLSALYVAYRLGKRRNDYMLLVIISGVLSFLLAKIATHIYQDPRPFLANPHIHPLFDSSRDNGFPSDHTLLAGLLAFTMLPYARRVGAGLVIVALLVGWGRVAGHVHHLKDIIGSLVITAFVSWAVFQVIRKVRPREADSTSA